MRGNGEAWVQDWGPPALALLIGYLLGSIPFGLLLTWAGGAGDLRQVGSGNIGATNVLRTGRKGLAAGTLILDAVKGATAVFAARAIAPDAAPDLALIGGAAAFVGHCYPVWLRFRGGKGLATYFGVALATAWPVGLVFAIVWLVVVGTFRYSSVGGIVAALAVPIAAAVRGDFSMAILFLSLAAIAVWRHRANIERLFAGVEPRVGQRA